MPAHDDAHDPLITQLIITLLKIGGVSCELQLSVETRRPHEVVIGMPDGRQFHLQITKLQALH